MPPIKFVTRPQSRSLDVQRISITTVSIWWIEGQADIALTLLRDEARDLGHALVAEANRPFDHHQREEENG